MQQPTKEQQELLDEAKRRYPVGTTITWGNNRTIVTDHHITTLYDDFAIATRASNSFNNCEFVIYVHSTSQWAEIVNLPQSQEKPMFSDCEIGECVYSVRYGKGEIFKIESKQQYTFFIGVKYSDRNFIRLFITEDEDEIIEFYNDRGESMTDQLYWSKPEIIAPPRPKRVVENTVDCWILTSHVKGRKITNFPKISIEQPTHYEYYTKATLTYKTEE